MSDTGLYYRIVKCLAWDELGKVYIGNQHLQPEKFRNASVGISREYHGLYQQGMVQLIQM